MTSSRGRVRPRALRPLLVSGRRRFWLAIAATALLAGFALFDASKAQDAMTKVATGARVLAEEGFSRLSGLRVGLLVNHTARVEDDHLIDLMFASGKLTLAALFAPEHGLRGDAYAGEEVRNSKDARTGTQVFSLYGKSHKPTLEMLRGLDVLVFDIQDVGARFYTYITTMGLAMQGAAKAGVTFVVLDRPNPIGGDYVSGFMMRDAQRSFIGKYPIPMAHGMTVGELARMIKGQAMLPGLQNLKLDVVKMRGWKRSMHWPDTGLGWVNPSPAIVDYETALIYAGTGLFEATTTNYGRGTDEPFKLIGAPWINADRLASEVNQLELPGLIAQPVRFSPRKSGTGAFQPMFAGQELPGIRLLITDPKAVLPVEAGISLLISIDRYARQAGQGSVVDKAAWLAKMSGTGRLIRMLNAGKSARDVEASWRQEVTAFKASRAPYLLYD